MGVTASERAAEVRKDLDSRHATLVEQHSDELRRMFAETSSTHRKEISELTRKCCSELENLAATQMQVLRSTSDQHVQRLATQRAEANVDGERAQMRLSKV